ncbi:MAG: PKD domain-containing protein [Bacteroidota bacterium]
MRNLIKKPIVLISGVVLMSGLFFLRPSCTKEDDNKPVAKFKLFSVYSTRFIKVGDYLEFLNQSEATSPYTLTWQFEGGTPSTSTEEHPVIKYLTPGKWDVKLIVADPNGMDWVEEKDYVVVSNTKDIIANLPKNYDDPNY